MNQFFKHKILSFTLAEMMVVLALFSVISAATMPVITARQKMEGTAASTSGGVEGDYEDPWGLKGSGMYYKPSNYTSAVMVGSDVNDSAQGLGYPALIVTDKVGIRSGNADPSQIKLFKEVDGTTYDCGRIMMGNDYMRSIGTVAIGANALAYNSNNFRSYNVAIGSNALNDRNAKADRYYNVAVGYNALSATRNSTNNNVGIGTEVGYKNKVNNSVLMGNMAGYTSNSSDSIDNSVIIGSHAGLNKSTQKSVIVGKYAGYNENNNPNNSVLIGYYAGYVMDGQAKAPDNFIAIGSYAFANNEYEPELGDTGIAIGFYAGNFGNFSSINIGRYAGFYNFEGDHSVNIGLSAGSEMNSASYYSVYLGNRAGMYAGGDDRICIGTDSCVNSDNSNESNVSIGHFAGYQTALNGDGGNVLMASPKSVMVGYYAGSDASVLRSVCIGTYACSGSNNYDGLVRISPKDGYWERSGNDTISVIGDIPNSIRNASMNTGYDSLIITPLYGSLTPAKSASSDNDSSIILFGDVFGPSNYLQAFSDKRLKENIRPTKYGLKEIRKINVYNYNWKTGDTKTPQIGVIAQEVQKIIPESVHVDKDNKIGGYLTVNSTWFLYPMVNAIKELDSQVTAIQKKLVAYSKEYISLVQRVNKLEKEVKVLEKENKTLTRDVKVAYTKVKKAERR